MRMKNLKRERAEEWTDAADDRKEREKMKGKNAKGREGAGKERGKGRGRVGGYIQCEEEEGKKRHGKRKREKERYIWRGVEDWRERSGKGRS